MKSLLTSTLLPSLLTGFLLLLPGFQSATRAQEQSDQSATANASSDAISGSTADDEIPNTQALEIPFTPPAKALSMLNLPKGFSATLFANEPDVIQPIAATTDSRGRLWIVECLTYSDRKQNYDLALHDRVIILEDTDNDGRHDKRTVFWDKGKKLTGIELGFGGVWLTAAPNLLFIPDANGDDQPDGPPQVLLNGFNGDEIRHNIVNGLRWGADGWLYGRHGIQATSHVGPPGASDSQRTPMNCAIWRIHPQSKRFEVVAEGGTNPWGFDYDDYGEMFMINTVIGHMFHIVPGARYRRMYGSHFNPHTYQVIEQTADHFHWDVSEEHWAVTKKSGMSDGTDAAGGGHAHTGLMCYLGGNWPKQYRNKWMTANFHGRRINVERTERDGCGYTARHDPDMIKSDDPWFRGVEMIYGPDGGVFLLDWSDIGECHENDGIHRTSGRIFKITFGAPERPESFDVSKWSDQQLVESVHMENQWFVRHARRILQERSVDGKLSQALVSKMAELCDSLLTAGGNDRDVRPLLRAMWALHSVGGTDSEFLLRCADDRNEHVRAWAIRLLDDRREVSFSKQVKSRLTEMAKTDASGLVRLYLASSLHRFDLKDDLQIFKNLLMHQGDSMDRTQPHLIWNRIEPQVSKYPAEAIALIKASQIPLLRENIARRITSSIETDPQLVEDLLTNIGPDLSRNANITHGMSLALEGWSNAEKPANWDATSRKIMRWGNQISPQSDEAVIWKSLKTDIRKLNLIFGDGQAVEALKKIANDNRASDSARRKAILQYAKTKPDGLFEFLKPLLRNRALSNSVIRGMAFSNSPEVAKAIINQFGNLSPSGKSIAVDVLTSRDVWANRLLDAISRNRIPRTSVLAQHARQVRNFEDEQLTKKLTRVWGSIRDTDQNRMAEMERVRKIIAARAKRETKPSDARHAAGQKLFTEKCASCHVLFGRGANVGPDLTGGDRKNVNYLLENIIDPNASVADAYRASKFALADGRLIIGVVLQETERTTKIQTATEIVTLDNSEIEQNQKTELSLMPDGLLENMSDQQIGELFSFLSEK